MEKITIGNMQYQVNKIRQKAKNTFYDSRLPKGYTIFLNRFEEYVVCNEFDVVAKIGNPLERNNVRASRTLEGAIQHYINNRISNYEVE